MFNPFDEHNHAGLLYGMRRSPLLGLAGPSDNRAGGTGNRAGTGERRRGQSIAQSVAALSPVRKQLLASLSGYADVTKWEPDFVAYLGKKFEKPDSDFTKSAKLLFAAACEYASNDDPTVLAYFDALAPALDAKAEAIKAGSAAKTDLSGAENQQAIIDAQTKSISEQQDTLKQSSAKLHSAVLNFVDWVQQSMKSIFGDEAVFAGNDPYTPWMLQQALYGKTPYYYNENEAVVDPDKVWGGGLPPFEAGPLPSAVVNGLKKGGALTYSDEGGLFDEYNFANGPALADIDPNTFVVAPEGGKAWIEVVNGKAYVAVGFAKGYWRYAGLGSTVPTRLRYDGPSRNVAPGGFCATQAWNQGVVTHATNMQTTQKKINEAKYAIVLATKERDKLKNSKAIQTSATASQKFDNLISQADAIKGQLKGFMLGYAETIANQLLAAVGLSAMTDARKAVQSKIDALKGEADTLTANAQKLIEDARNEQDPEKRARMRSEAEKRLSRATGIARRRMGLIEDSGKLGEDRRGRVKRIKDEADRTGVVIPMGDVTVTDANGKPVKVDLPTGGDKVSIPKGSKLHKKILPKTETVAQNTAEIALLTQHQQEQQKVNENLRQTVIALAEKLPEKYKPNLPPPPPPPKEQGGGLGLIVAGLVAFAALRNK